jgi:hypothetical protein
LRRGVLTSFLARFKLFTEVGLSRAKRANSFIDIVVEPLKEPCVCRGCKKNAGEYSERLYH